MANIPQNRIYFLDYLRALACFMVIMVHSCEFFFINGDSIGIRSDSDGFWVCLIDSAFRCSVPLFVMISGYLLVPLRKPAGAFFRNRLKRVIIPFAIWSVLYATLPAIWGEMTRGDVADALRHLSFNFNGSSGHMWFVYMITGIYLFMPVISPWLASAGKKAEQAFLLLWLLSTSFPYLREIAGDIYGECYWNEFNLLWYFSGFLGYIVLAHYVRHHLQWSPRKMLTFGAALYLAGYAITALVWYGRMNSAQTLRELELSWRFCTPNVVAMSLGVFLIAKALLSGRTKESKPIKSIAGVSYGIYLMHIFLLNAFFAILRDRMPVPAVILSNGLLTFAACYLLSRLLSRLPGGRYLVG